jgi:hypothetical protein
MKVKFKQNIGYNGQSYTAGEIYDIEELTFSKVGGDAVEVIEIHEVPEELEEPAFIPANKKMKSKDIKKK